MKETKLYSRLQPYLNRWGEVDRVENSLGSGMSDVFYNIDGKVGWLETKIVKSGKLYFEKFQPNWMRKHVRAGFNNIFVVALALDETILAWPAEQVVKAPCRSSGKFIVVDVSDVGPGFSMPRPYTKWLAFKDMLIS